MTNDIHYSVSGRMLWLIAGITHDLSVPSSAMRHDHSRSPVDRRLLERVECVG
jgi:hypothetical protein